MKLTKKITTLNEKYFKDSFINEKSFNKLVRRAAFSVKKKLRHYSPLSFFFYVTVLTEKLLSLSL